MERTVKRQPRQEFCRGVAVLGGRPLVSDVYVFGKTFGRCPGDVALFLADPLTVHATGRRSFLTAEAAVRAARDRFIDRLTALICNRDVANLWPFLRGDTATMRERMAAAVRLLRAGIDLDADGIAGVLEENNLWDEFTKAGA